MKNNKFNSNKYRVKGIKNYSTKYYETKNIWNFKFVRILICKGFHNKLNFCYILYMKNH